MTRESERIPATVLSHAPWRRWGPYVSERAWATVREDYSATGDAWSFLPHDLARSKAFRWGEDAIAGLCDRFQLLVFAPVFWNGQDLILKERLFGLTPYEGNHGEDVKEYYFYLDNVPSHAYMKYLYKYPQRAYPYAWLVEENRRLGQGLEFELLDTGIFDDDRYFDIFIEYAKETPEDICVRIEACNRGPEAAPLHILPHLWFRNTWSWGRQPLPQPEIRSRESEGVALDTSEHRVADVMVEGDGVYRMEPRTLYGPAGANLLFTDNETNADRVFGLGHISRSPYTKDAFHRHVVDGEASLNPQQIGTKAALHYRFDVPARGSVVLQLRLTHRHDLADPLAGVDAVVNERRQEADEFYASIQPATATEDERRVQRQAFAGLLWNKMTYLWGVERWLDGDNPDCPPPAARQTIRNTHWRHHYCDKIISPCEKWEYPWFAAWDLAFTYVPLALVDPTYAKEQLLMLLFETFQHADGQIPAYEWEFSDLNPPVQAWAVWRVFKTDLARTGVPDLYFLEVCFHKLLINFAWWVNKVDRQGNNIFEGGFLGMDNISIVDRSMSLADGAMLEQSDASGYMTMFCLNLMRISLELAQHNHAYAGLVIKFLKHYMGMARAMKRMGGRDYQLWDERDGFFYDVLRYPDGRFHKFRLRSLVGLIPLFAVERMEDRWIEAFPVLRTTLDWGYRQRRELFEDVVHEVTHGDQVTLALTVVDREQIQRIMARVWNEAEFLSNHGIRSLSKAHEKEPFVNGDTAVRYEPAESESKLKGGNSNWRGPVWFPTCFLLVESFRKLGQAFGEDFRMQVPAAAEPISFAEMASDLSRRLVSLFLRGTDGRRPVFGGSDRFQNDPHWKDYLLFYEYFDGDTGAGLGASHQTGWTGLVASLIDDLHKHS